MIFMPAATGPASREVQAAMNDGPDQPGSRIRRHLAFEPESHERLLDCVPCQFFVAKDATGHGGEVPDERARDLRKAIVGQRSTRLRCILQQPGRSFQVPSRLPSEIGSGILWKGPDPLRRADGNDSRSAAAHPAAHFRPDLNGEDHERARSYGPAWPGLAAWATPAFLCDGRSSSPRPGQNTALVLENPVKDAADGCHNPRWIVAASLKPTPLDEGLTSRRIASTERSARVEIARVARRLGSTSFRTRSWERQGDHAGRRAGGAGRGWKRRRRSVQTQR